MNRKIDIKIVILIILGMFLIDTFLVHKDDPIEDVTVVIPEKVGSVEKEIDSVKVDTVYIVEQGGKEKPRAIVVDSTYKAEYEKAIAENDSLKAKNIFLESIAITKYKDTLINNKDILIKGDFTTRGKLLNYKIDYTIKADTITYTPQVVRKNPKFALVGGIELGLPLNGIVGDPTASINLGIRNVKGNTITFGFDTEKRFRVGYQITLFQSKK